MSDSTESVSIDTMKIWTGSIEKILNNLSQEIKAVAAENKETNKHLIKVIDLLKEDQNTLKSILSQHITEYNHNEKQNNVRFKNAFQRLNNVDDILRERKPAYESWTKLSKTSKAIILTAVLAAAGTAGTNLYTSIVNKEDQKPKQTVPEGQ